MSSAYRPATPNYAAVKPIVDTRNKYKRGMVILLVIMKPYDLVSAVSTGHVLPVCDHDTPNFKKNARSKLNTRANVQYRPSPGNFHMRTNDVKRFVRDAKPKVDTSDPIPWARHPRALEELTDCEGFLINPRFKRLVQSGSFQSSEELHSGLCRTDEKLGSSWHNKEKEGSSELQDLRSEETEVEKAGSWTVEDMEEETRDMQAMTEGDELTRHENMGASTDTLSAQLNSCSSAPDK